MPDDAVDGAAGESPHTLVDGAAGEPASTAAAGPAGEPAYTMAEGVAGEPTYTAAEVDAAIAALQAPERLRHAQDVVTHAAPTLQRALAEALHEGGWFGDAHDAEVARAAAEPDAHERARVVATLVAEQTRLGMFVGAAVGFELARELRRAQESPAQGLSSEATPLAQRPAAGPAASEPAPNPKN